MFSRLESVIQKFQRLEEDLGNPDVLANQKEYQHVAKERSDLAPIVERYSHYKSLKEQVLESQSLLELEEDAEMRDLIREELTSLKEQLDATENDLKLMLVPKDPRDDKNVILEIRAGTGGEEAALFAADPVAGVRPALHRLGTDGRGRTQGRVEHHRPSGSRQFRDSSGA